MGRPANHPESSGALVHFRQEGVLDKPPPGFVGKVSLPHSRRGDGSTRRTLLERARGTGRPEGIKGRRLRPRLHRFNQGESGRVLIEFPGSKTSLGASQLSGAGGLRSSLGLPDLLTGKPNIALKLAAGAGALAQDRKRVGAPAAAYGWR
jgi:hypothetical protein